MEKVEGSLKEFLTYYNEKAQHYSEICKTYQTLISSGTNTSPSPPPLLTETLELSPRVHNFKLSSIIKSKFESKSRYPAYSQLTSSRTNKIPEPFRPKSCVPDYNSVKSKVFHN